MLKDCLILGGAGVGGGSLNYANTLYEPPQPFYDDTQWAHITDWRDELAPHYDQAKRMLGVVTNPTTTPSDVEMQRLAEQFGKADTYTRHSGRRVLRPGRGGGTRAHRARPVLRRRRPGADRLHPVRGVHDRLPPRREEHARRPTTCTSPRRTARRSTR